MGGVGVDLCPKGYEEIYDIETCKLASSLLGFAYSDVDNDGMLESVCNWCGGCEPRTIRVDSRHEEMSQWICQKGMFGVIYIV